MQIPQNHNSRLLHFSQPNKLELGSFAAPNDYKFSSELAPITQHHYYFKILVWHAVAPPGLSVSQQQNNVLQVKTTAYTQPSLIRQMSDQARKWVVILADSVITKSLKAVDRKWGFPSDFTATDIIYIHRLYQTQHRFSGLKNGMRCHKTYSYFATPAACTTKFE